MGGEGGRESREDSIEDMKFQNRSWGLAVMGRGEYQQFLVC